MSSITDLGKRYGSILFRGFHHRQEDASNGWVYWLPRYIHKHSGLKVYFLTNDGELFFLDPEEKLVEIARNEIGVVDIFFGRTANSFDQGDPLILSAGKKIVYPISNTAPETYRGHGITIIDDSDFIKPIPDYERQFFYYDQSIAKENILLFPAGIQKRKGQLDFAKKVSKRALKGHKVILCGTIKSERYADSCFSVLRKRGIDFEYLPKVSKSELGTLYRKARLTLIPSRNDWNPRTFYESMACGTPTLLSHNVRIARSLDNLAFRSSTFWLNRNLQKSLDYPGSYQETLQQRALQLTEKACYEQLFRKAMAEGASGQRT